MKDSLFSMAYTSDLFIFGIDSRECDSCRSLPKKYFSILLVKREKEPFQGKWCLPGGFVLENETSKESSIRILKKETGLENVYMQQVRVNDCVDRDPRGRVVSISYMALIDRTKIKAQLNEEACWFDVEIEDKGERIFVTLCNGEEEIQYSVGKKIIDRKTYEYEYDDVDANSLAFDHAKMIVEGVMELRKKVNDTDIVFHLMPDLFTIGELKQVYEILLGKKLVNSAFRRTIAEKVELTDTMVKTGGHRPSVLCKYKEN